MALVRSELVTEDSMLKTTTTTTTQTIEQKLSRARVLLLLSQPFFGTLCLRLKLVCMPSFPTMAPAGQRLVSAREVAAKKKGRAAGKARTKEAADG